MTRKSDPKGTARLILPNVDEDKPFMEQVKTLIKAFDKPLKVVK